MRFAGKAGIVTGGGAGIGAATARLLASEGAPVTIADKDEAAANATVEQINQDGGEAMAIVGDLAHSSVARRVVEETLSRFGGVHILVNNAGVELKCPVDETSEHDWDRVLGANLKSAFLMSKEVIPIMKARRTGAIVMNSSVAYYIGAPNSAAYGASKAGLLSLTRCMALELAPFNIRVNAVCPGVIDTPMNTRNLERAEDPKAMRQSWFDVTPMKRLGTPEDVAKAILFLASDDAGFITGTPLVVDGGRLAQ